jgi:hypothetical protein
MVGLPGSLLVTVIVPYRVPAAVGVYVPLKVQLAPAASEPGFGHVVDAAKSPVEPVTELIAMAEVPTFFNVAFSFGDLVPRLTIPNLTKFGVSVRFDPIPVKETLWGLPGSDMLE